MLITDTITVDDLAATAARFLRTPGASAGASDTIHNGTGSHRVESATTITERLFPTQPPALQTAIKTMNDEFVFCRHPVGILSLKERELLSKGDFLTLVANRYALDGEPQRVVQVGPPWLRSTNRLECEKLVYEPAYRPGMLSEGSFNLYRPLEIKPREGDIAPWKRLLDHVFKGQGSRRERKFFEQWVAYPLKHPGTKMYTACLVWGTSGAGKSLLGEIIGSLYGDNYHELSGNDLLSQFNTYQKFRQFILVNEILSTGLRADADKLKALITQQAVSINEKFKPAFQVRDTANYYLTSNHPDALRFDREERRYFVVRVDGTADMQVYNEAAELKVKGREALLWHFLNEVDLTGFNPKARALETAARSEMIETSMSDLDRFIRDEIDAVRAGQVPVVRYKQVPVVCADKLRKKFEDTYKTKTNPKAMSEALHKCGAIPLGQKRIAGERASWWSVEQIRQEPDEAV